MRIIKLDGYNATVDNGKKLELGTFDSYGEEQLQIVKAQNWENLSVLATFNPPSKKPVQVVVDSVTGVIKVPKEATANLYGVGTIVFVGLADGVQRISADVEYIVRKHSNANGTEPAEPTPSVVQQILTEAQNANTTSAEAKKLATDAKDIAQSVRTDADNGKFTGAKGDKGDDGTTPQLKIGEDNLWHVSYDNGATWVSLGVKATGDAGKDGEDGVTPHIGENGNWWVGDTDTGVSAKGDKGDTGAKGADGVSPTASVTQTDDGAEFTVTDANGTTTAMIRNGTDGKDGAPGAPGKDAVVDATLTQDGQAADAKVTGEKIGQLKKDLSNKITKFYASNQGETHLTDSDSGKIMDMMLYGKSSQDGTPTLENPVEVKCVVNPTVKVTNEDNVDSQSFTVNDVTLCAVPVKEGGNITVNGQQYIADYIDVENGKIVKYVKKLFLKTFGWSKAINKGVLRFYGSTIDVVGISGNKVIKNTFSISSHFAFVTGTPDRIGTFTSNSDGTNANMGFAFSTDTTITSDYFNNWILNNKPFVLLPVSKEELPLTSEQTQALKELATYYPVTNIGVNSKQLDGYTVFNYPISMANGWNYVKQQLNDNRDYIYDMDLQSAEAYVNSEYAVALTELEV
jgi:hypothetical protein